MNCGREGRVLSSPSPSRPLCGATVRCSNNLSPRGLVKVRQGCHKRLQVSPYSALTMMKNALMMG